MSQIPFIFNKKENEVKACVAHNNCSHDLSVLAKGASMEFDFFKFDSVAINLYLVVYSAQVQKITGMVDFTQVACPVKCSAVVRHSKCFSGFQWVLPVTNSHLAAAEAKLSFFFRLCFTCLESIHPLHGFADGNNSFTLWMRRLSALPFITHTNNCGFGRAIQVLDLCSGHALRPTAKSFMIKRFT